MPLEIERKFLVQADKFLSSSDGLYLKQGYLNLDPDRTVRVRVAGEKAWMTIKGRTENATRLEFEYPIPVEEAETLLNTLCHQVLEKVRYTLPAGDDLMWEVDVFLGPNAPLVIAEIELPDLEASFPRPLWLGEEITHDDRYYNSQLAQFPFQSWE